MSGRYARQSVLPEVGTAGQARLAAARVLVIGAGGLGCPVLQYLAGAGVGRLTIVDPDVVDVTNLHRQPLYRMTDLGRPKAAAARDAVLAFNPEIAVAAIPAAFDPVNAGDLVADADVVVDAADSFAATYVASDACRDAVRPLVSASVLGLGGYAGAFCGGAPSYRAVFPEPPGQAASCATAGVLGPAVGLVGALQAQLTLALLLGLAPSPLGRLISVDVRALTFGGFGFAGAAEPAGPSLPFLAPSAIVDGDVVIDLRGADEAPPFPGAIRAPVDRMATLDLPGAPDARVVLCCRSGLRAWRAASTLAGRGRRNLALVALGDPA